MLKLIDVEIHIYKMRLHVLKDLMKSNCIQLINKLSVKLKRIELIYNRLYTIMKLIVKLIGLICMLYRMCYLCGYYMNFVICINLYTVWDPLIRNKDI